MAEIIAFPNPKRGYRLEWMTLDQFEIHMAELEVQTAEDRLILLRLEQYGRWLEGSA